tara:strand:- start:3633 stop:4247 length:615 start_codon:yes stop_codon:yes gene_type:complete
MRNFKYFTENFKFFPEEPLTNISIPSPNLDLDSAVEKLKKLMSTRTPENEESIRLHDEQPFYAIEKYCEKNGLMFHDNEMMDIVRDANPTIYHFKNKFKLTRPFDHDRSIAPMVSTTNKTFSYPSGHATQSMLVGLYVSSKFPEHKEGVIEAAKECGYGRVLAGWHYMQDYTAGNLLAEKMFPLMNKSDYGKALSKNDKINRKR